MSPDGSAKPPPEEKLLALIRGKGARAAARPIASSATDAVMAAGSGSGFSPWLQKLPWLRLCIGFLAVLLIVEAVCFITQALRPMPLVNPPLVSIPEATGALRAAEPLEIPSLEEGFSRALFSSPALTPAPQANPIPSTSATQLASRLSLIGIVAGNPSQAIIEDAQTSKTFFVTVGQPVVEGAVVEKILDNRVVLDLGGEKIELAL